MPEAAVDPVAPAFADVASTRPGGGADRYRAALRTTARPDVRPDHLAEFIDVRDRLLCIARRIVGNRSDAEDVVQDAWLRWDHTDRGAVHDVPAFLCRTTTLLSINAIQTAHVRHQSPTGVWPANWPDRGDDPVAVVERMEELRAAMLLLIERLTPRERSAFVLREAFGYPHRQIGDVLSLTETNARQLIRRARVRLAADPGRPASPAEQLRLLTAFRKVARTGDPSALADIAKDPGTSRAAGPAS
ncbi:sigma-70 family RNA polymerase sigma factor [Dactylosporangium sp. NPDC051485]|uniref:sigma-70 family RNA polymerase sigma factor n=1 Tax=Dactylosporangium sp. NPDC051485 TaxID=3154846 RepID=UPI003441486E